MTISLQMIVRFSRVLTSNSQMPALKVMIGEIDIVINDLVFWD